MVQLIKVTQVTSAIKRPASRSQRTRLPFDHLDIQKKQIQTNLHYMKKCNNKKLQCIRITYFCVTEEGIENLPHKNDWTQQQIGNPNPQNTWRQPVCQLKPVTSSLVLWFQAPLILKQRTYTASKEKNIWLLTLTHKNMIGFKKKKSHFHQRHLALTHLGPRRRWVQSCIWDLACRTHTPREQEVETAQGGVIYLPWQPREVQEKNSQCAFL